jgi:hypothetical protein
MPSFLLSTHKQCILSHFIHNSLLCSPKNLIPWRDSNPGLLVPQADAMSTPSGHLQKGLGIPLSLDFRFRPLKYWLCIFISSITALDCLIWDLIIHPYTWLWMNGSDVERRVVRWYTYVHTQNPKFYISERPCVENFGILFSHLVYISCGYLVHLKDILRTFGIF